MIKILQYGLTNHQGGIETYLYRLVSNSDLSKIHYDFLIIGQEKPCYYEELTTLGCNFYFVTPRSVSVSRNKKEVTDLISSGNYDIVQANLNSLSYITPVQVARKLNVPTIVHSRNAGIKSSIKSRVLHNINAYKLNKFNLRRLAVSKYAGEWMFGDKQFQIINNGIDTKKYQFSNISRLKIRQNYSISENTEVIIHTGALRAQKNHKFILSIFKEYLKLNSNSILVLVGSGELRDEIETLIQDLGIEKEVILAGNQTDIPAYLSMGDKYLFPSWYEGFPNSVLEAQNSGLPCLISDTITDEVIVNDNCKMFSLDNPQSDWARELLYLSKTERQDSYKLIESKGFSVSDEIKKISDIYFNIVS